MSSEPAAPPSEGPPASAVPALAARSISKQFPGVVANDRVTFEVLPGEIHALLGENGAGKTTLCNVLTGLYRPDEGTVEVRGEEVRFRSPKDAIAVSRTVTWAFAPFGRLLRAGKQATLRKTNRVAKPKISSRTQSRSSSGR